MGNKPNLIKLIGIYERDSSQVDPETRIPLFCPIFGVSIRETATSRSWDTAFTRTNQELVNESLEMKEILRRDCGRRLAVVAIKTPSDIG